MSRELDEILVRLADLLDGQRERERADGDETEDNFRCEGCIDCSNCRFCIRCERCEDCTYCEDCSQSIGCTQSRGLHECAGCTHSFESARCEDGSYLSLCYGCVDSVHCFACVGLEAAEFCILNEKYPRSEYFKQVAALREQLERKLRAGWSAPWRARPAEPPLAKQEPTGTWPPADAESARMLDRGLEDDEDLWAELDELVGVRSAAVERAGESPLSMAQGPTEQEEYSQAPTEQESLALGLALTEHLAHGPAPTEQEPYGPAHAEHPARGPSNRDLFDPVPDREPTCSGTQPTRSHGHEESAGSPSPTGSVGRWGSGDPLPPSRARWTRGEDGSRTENASRSASGERGERGWLVAARRPEPDER